MLTFIQNDPEVPPGNLLDFCPVPYSIHHPWRDGFLPKPEDISALIVLGGAMGANDDERYPFLTDLKSLIRDVVTTGIPYLGVCLGGQLLAAALGAPVVSLRWEELGVSAVTLSPDGRDDLLFRGLSRGFTTFQWHHDSFDIPPNGVLLASSPACPNQAFRVGSRVWGVQFHPEVTEAIITDWCAWDPETRARTGALLAAFRKNAADYGRVARTILANFLNISYREASP